MMHRLIYFVLVSIFQIVLFPSIGFSQNDSLRAREILNESKDAEALNQLPLALEKAEQASAIFKNGKIWYGYVVAEFQVAKMLSNSRQNAKAHQTLADLENFLSTEIPEAKLVRYLFYQERGVYLLSRHKYEKALSDFETAYEGLTSHYGSKNMDVARVMVGLSRVYERLNDLPRSISYFEESLEIMKAELPSDDSELIKAFQNVGAAYSSLGDYDKALIYFQESLNRIDKSEEGYLLGRAYFKLGECYFYMQEFEQALVYLERSKDIYKAGGPQMQKDLNLVLSTLSNTHIKLGNNEKAIRYGEMVLESYKSLPPQKRFMIAQMYNSLGTTYSSLGGEHDKAIEYLKKAAEIVRNQMGDDFYGQAYNFHNLSVVYSRRNQPGDIDSSIYYADRCIQIRKKNLSPHNYRLAQSYLARAYGPEILKEHGEALHYVQKGLNTLLPQYQDTNIYSNPKPSTLTDQPNTFLSLMSYKGRSLLFRGLIEPYTIKDLELALQTYEIALEFSDSVMIKTGNSARGKEMELATQSIYEHAMINIHTLYSITKDRKYLEKAFNLSERGKSLLLQQSVQLSQGYQFAGVPDSIPQQEKSLRLDYGSIQNKALKARAKGDSASLREHNKELFEIKKQLLALEERIKVDYPDYYRMKYDLNTISIEKVQEQLPENTALLSYMLSNKHVQILAISKNTVEFNQTVHNGRIMETVKDLRKNLSDYALLVKDPAQAKTSYLNSSSSLYKQLFPENIRSVTQGCDNLVIIPDGLLNFIPFEALLTDSTVSPETSYQDLPYLLKDHSIGYAYSATLWSQPLSPSTATKSYLGMAPSYDYDQMASSLELLSFRTFRDKPTPLLANQNEVENINQLMGGEIFKGDRASEEVFKQKAADYKVLHLAMHALTDDRNPMNSRLLFNANQDSTEDGFLNVYELYNLSLNAELVVLSACNTGYGKILQGEGPMSLARAFRYAGVPSMVMSLWQAEDETTSKLMTDFFAGLHEGKDKSTSLREAKLNYLAQADDVNGHPFFWANFVLIGNPSALSVDGELGGPGFIAMLIFLVASLILILQILGVINIIPGRSTSS